MQVYGGLGIGIREGLMLIAGLAQNHSRTEGSRRENVGWVIQAVGGRYSCDRMRQVSVASASIVS